MERCSGNAALHDTLFLSQRLGRAHYGVSVMIDTVSAREADRQAIAALMAKFEEENGPIETMPIIVGEDKKLPYRINSSAPDKVKPVRAASGLGKGSHSKAQRASNIERVKPYLDSGLSYTEIGKQLGLTGTTVSSIFKELKGGHNR